jgi:hypothetical protein
MASRAEQPAAQPQPEARKAHRRPLRRWLWRILVFVVGLALVLGIFFQIVLWTGLPRSIVVSIVEKGLGVRMGVTRLSTGWFGHTTLTGVRVALPLSPADQSFLEIPEMRVNHTNLVALLFGSDITIKEVDLSKPILHVRQDASGRWNVNEVTDLLTRLAGRNAAGQTGQSSAVAALPRLRIDELTIDVIDNRHRELKVQPVNVDGAPETPVSWKYDVEIPSGDPNVPPRLSLLGRVAPGGAWTHNARIWVHDVGDWVRVWKPNFNSPLMVDANWSGQLTDNGVSGFMRIADSQFGDYHADGAFSAEQAADLYTVAPRNLHIRGPNELTSDVRLPRGLATYDGRIFKLTRLQIALLSGLSELNGWYEPDINQGAVEASWDSLKFDKWGVTQSGKLNATYRNPPASNLDINLTFSSTGTAPDGPFGAVLKANLNGRNFQEFGWNLEAPQLNYQRPNPIILDGVTAAGTYQASPGHKMVRLDSVALPTDRRLAGTGSYDLLTKQGQLHLSGQDWPMRLIEGTRLEFALDATAQGVPSPQDPRVTKLLLNLNQFFLRSGETGLTVTGSYDGRLPKPISADVVFQNEPGSAVSEAPPVIQGFLRGEAKLNGTLQPLDIKLEGDLEGQEAAFLNHPIGDVHTAVHGGIDYNKAFIRADEISFLRGVWTLGATYTTHQNNRPVYATEINLSIDRLPLHSVSQFLGSRTIEGVFQGRWSIYFPGLRPTRSKIIVTGTGQITKLFLDPFVADSITFDSAVRNGNLTIDPIRINRGTYGRIDANARIELADWRQILTGVQFTQFPLDLTPQLTVTLNGGTRQIEVLLPDAHSHDPVAQKLRVRTDMNLRASVTVNQQPLGEVRLLPSMRDRTIDLREADGNLLGGKITGDAVVDIDDLNRSRVNVAWDGLQSERFARLYPYFTDVGGSLAGNARLAPATVERPLGPLALDIYLRPTEVHWRTVQFTGGELHAYLDARTHQFVASDARPTRFQIADGSVDLWFSASRHIDTRITPAGDVVETGVTISNQVNATFNRLDIDQFVHAFDPKHGAGSGRLGGQAYLLSAPKTRQIIEFAQASTGGIPRSATSPATGPTTAASSGSGRSVMQEILATAAIDGDLEISDSDLGNFAPIAFLYNLMHLGRNIRAPTGRGTVDFIMESGTLRVTNLSYFNRGVEVHGVAAATRMWEIPDNPIQGSVVGTARPLKNIKLPIFAEADTILAQLQLQLSSVEFKGTVRNPTQDFVRQLNLAQAGAELRGLLLGEVSSNPRQ